MKSYKKGELAEAILLLSVGLVVVATVCVAPGLAIIFKELNAKNAKDRYRIKRALQKMESQGIFIRQIKNGKEVLVVSEKGKNKAWSTLPEDLQIPKQKKWDGKWRLVTFDIPERKSRVRKEVSYKIKAIGMEAIQDSVFVSPFPCKSEVDRIAEHFDVKEFFIYLEAGLIESNQDLLKKFNLSNV
jgi:phenylacetic acid degradation operon negative regulatory protein